MSGNVNKNTATFDNGVNNKNTVNNTAAVTGTGNNVNNNGSIDFPGIQMPPLARGEFNAIPVRTSLILSIPSSSIKKRRKEEKKKEKSQLTCPVEHVLTFQQASIMFGAMSFPMASESVHLPALHSVAPATTTKTSEQCATKPNDKYEIDSLFNEAISKHDDEQAANANGQVGSNDDNDNEDDEDAFAATPFTWDHIAASHEGYVAAQQQAHQNSKLDSLVSCFSC